MNSEISYPINPGIILLKDVTHSGDFTILVKVKGTGCMRPLPCHRAVLLAHSDKLRHILIGEKFYRMSISLPGELVDTFSQVIASLYTLDDTFVTDKENAVVIAKSMGFDAMVPVFESGRKFGHTELSRVKNSHWVNPTSREMNHIITSTTIGDLLLENDVFDFSMYIKVGQTEGRDDTKYVLKMNRSILVSQSNKLANILTRKNRYFWNIRIEEGDVPHFMSLISFLHNYRAHSITDIEKVKKIARSLGFDYAVMVLNKLNVITGDACFCYGFLENCVNFHDPYAGFDSEPLFKSDETTDQSNPSFVYSVEIGNTLISNADKILDEAKAFLIE